MTNRRTFLGTALAATAVGGAGLITGREEKARTVDFYARKSGARLSTGGLFGVGDVALGAPEQVEPGSLNVGPGSANRSRGY